MTVSLGWSVIESWTRMRVCSGYPMHRLYVTREEAERNTGRRDVVLEVFVVIPEEEL